MSDAQDPLLKVVAVPLATLVIGRLLDQLSWLFVGLAAVVAAFSYLAVWARREMGSVGVSLTCQGVAGVAVALITATNIATPISMLVALLLAVGACLSASTKPLPTAGAEIIGITTIAFAAALAVSVGRVWTLAPGITLALWVLAASALMNGFFLLFKRLKLVAPLVSLIGALIISPMAIWMDPVGRLFPVVGVGVGSVVLVALLARAAWLVHTHRPTSSLLLPFMAAATGFILGLQAEQGAAVAFGAIAGCVAGYALNGSLPSRKARIMVAGSCCALGYVCVAANVARLNLFVPALFLCLASVTTAWVVMRTRDYEEGSGERPAPRSPTAMLEISRMTSSGMP